MHKRNPRHTDNEWLDLIQKCRSSGLSDNAGARNIISIQATFITRYEDSDKKPVRYRHGKLGNPLQRGVVRTRLLENP